VNLSAVIEGLLFVVGEDGLTLDQLSRITECDKDVVATALSSLREEYEKENRGIRIHFLGNTFKLTTKKEHHPYYQKLVEVPGTNKLSQAALETLAIIAYNEPITRGEVDEIRGVSSVQLVRKLLAKSFIKEVGRSDAPGRPILYQTTSEFLDYFGLATVEDLPKLEITGVEDSQVDDGVDLYQSKYKEEQTIEEEIL